MSMRPVWSAAISVIARVKTGTSSLISQHCVQKRLQPSILHIICAKITSTWLNFSEQNSIELHTSCWQEISMHKVNFGNET